MSPCVCEWVACAESADTKLKHLIFTHLLEKHLCEISIYNTHDGIDHREVPQSTRRRTRSIARNIFGCAMRTSLELGPARPGARAHFWWRNQSDLLIWVVVGARGSRPFFQVYLLRNCIWCRFTADSSPLQSVIKHVALIVCAEHSTLVFHVEHNEYSCSAVFCSVQFSSVSVSFCSTPCSVASPSTPVHVFPLIIPNKCLY